MLLACTLFEVVLIDFQFWQFEQKTIVWKNVHNSYKGILWMKNENLIFTIIISLFRYEDKFWNILLKESINCPPEVKGEMIKCFLISSRVFLGTLTSSRVTFDSLDIRNSTEKIIKSNLKCKHLLNIILHVILETL